MDQPLFGQRNKKVEWATYAGGFILAIILLFSVVSGAVMGFLHWVPQHWFFALYLIFLYMFLIGMYLFYRRDDPDPKYFYLMIAMVLLFVLCCAVMNSYVWQPEQKCPKQKPCGLKCGANDTAVCFTNYASCSAYTQACVTVGSSGKDITATCSECPSNNASLAFAAVASPFSIEAATLAAHTDDLETQLATLRQLTARLLQAHATASLPVPSAAAVDEVPSTSSDGEIDDDSDQDARWMASYARRATVQRTTQDLLTAAEWRALLGK